MPPTNRALTLNDYAISHEFNKIRFTNWTLDQEQEAAAREIQAAEEQLAYLWWLRDVS